MVETLTEKVSFYEKQQRDLRASLKCLLSKSIDELEQNLKEFQMLMKEKERKFRQVRFMIRNIFN